MTSKELLGCLKDRPCSVCKFRDEEGCHKWNCVFEEPTDDVEFDSVIEDIKAEIKDQMDDDDYFCGLSLALQIIDKHISGKENK